jgi:PhnB protein
MTQINSYLTFNGNCREAMNFYKDCLGGELNLQTIAESPLADKMPAQMKE